jgi:creatinine amidohydrolase
MPKARSGAQFALAFTLGSSLLAAVTAATPDTVFLEELTSTEVKQLISSGRSSIILPTGGTEQNGPHMVLGKHNFIVKHAAEQIARRLGSTLVAPVLAYVPEGSIDPPTGHMLHAGTISIPDDLFAKVVEYAARSFRAAGFKHIILIGDSGPNQKGLGLVAEMLNREWRKSNVRVHFVSEYYDDKPFIAWLRTQGETAEAIGTHAGISDTSQLLAIRPDGIRREKLAPGGDSNITGVKGDPSRATVLYGQKALGFKIEQSVAQVRRLISAKQE